MAPKAQSFGPHESAILNLRGRLLAHGAQEEAGDGLAVGGHVEGAAVADAREGAAGDVAHGVSTRLARGDAALVEHAHRGLGLGQLHEVKLEVLPRGDVGVSVAPTLGHLGHRDERPGRGHALRELHADHLLALLPLSVDAAGEAVAPEVFGRDLAALEAPEGLDELVDVARVAEAREVG